MYNLQGFQFVVTWQARKWVFGFASGLPVRAVRLVFDKAADEAKIFVRPSSSPRTHALLGSCGCMTAPACVDLCGVWVHVVGFVQRPWVLLCPSLMFLDFVSAPCACYAPMWRPVMGARSRVHTPGTSACAHLSSMLFQVFWIAMVLAINIWVRLCPDCACVCAGLHPLCTRIPTRRISVSTHLAQQLATC